MLQDAFGNAVTSVAQESLFLSFDSLSYIGDISQDVPGLFAATFMPNLIAQVTPDVLTQHPLILAKWKPYGHCSLAPGADAGYSAKS